MSVPPSPPAEHDGRDVPSHGVQLLPHELRWRDKQPFLLEHGYLLRPRFRPNWVPSWLSDRENAGLHEDFWPLNRRPNLIDATRISDDRLVFVKEVLTSSNELKIATYFSEAPQRDDPRNHCVPIFDSFQDRECPQISYMVMPYLRHVDNPPFRFISDVVDFVDQLLEGLAFMHEHHVAHRDCAALNLMMDARSLFPRGHHPESKNSLPDMSDDAPHILRVASRTPVKYYYVDFGLSSQFTSDGARELVTGIDGLERDLPELSDSTKYDPFKADVFIVGNVLRRQILSAYANVDFIAPLFEHMTRRNPDERPSAAEALDEWKRIRKRVWLVLRVCRLRPHSEHVAKSALLAIRDVFVFGSAITQRYLPWAPRHHL